MSLVTPDFGLLFWMFLIFGVVFFVLAKWGFPMITNMVEARNEHIEKSLESAAEARRQLASLAEEQKALIDDARVQQAAILREAARTKEEMIAQAKEEAGKEAAKVIEAAKDQIAAEKEAALKDIRRQVSELSLAVAEKVLRENLSKTEQQYKLLDHLVDEMSSSDKVN